jgi:hypothetical protein
MRTELIDYIIELTRYFRSVDDFDALVSLEKFKEVMKLTEEEETELESIIYANEDLRGGAIC